jgi:SAM-dependent methyltransferase
MNAKAVMFTPGQRGRCEGLSQIVRFNYPMFITAFCIALCALGARCIFPLPRLFSWSLLALALATVGWSLSALAVSWYVYDRAPTFRFGWLSPWVGALHRWANVHAGFDQTTPMLRQALPGTTGTPIDIYDVEIMTEPSIRKARAAYPDIPGTLAASFDHLPLPHACVEGVFMLFAAHELRRPEQRGALFKEAARVLRPGGILVLAEHPRDVAGFAAFGPGAFHFHSPHQWRCAGNGAGLTLEKTAPLTPFAFYQIWRKPHDP